MHTKAQTKHRGRQAYRGECEQTKLETHGCHFSAKEVTGMWNERENLDKFGATRSIPVQKSMQAQVRELKEYRLHVLGPVLGPLILWPNVPDAL